MIICNCKFFISRYLWLIKRRKRKCIKNRGFLFYFSFLSFEWLLWYCESKYLPFPLTMRETAIFVLSIWKSDTRTHCFCRDHVPLENISINLQKNISSSILLIVFLKNFLLILVYQPIKLHLATKMTKIKECQYQKMDFQNHPFYLIQFLYW